MSAYVHFDTILVKNYKMDTVDFTVDKTVTFDLLGTMVLAGLVLNVVVN